MPGINAHCEAHLTGSQRRRLRLARENGFLAVAWRDSQKLLAAFALWCWRLHIPVVWSERCSARSRYGRVCLDLYTTSQRLTAGGQSELHGLAPSATISPHDGRWEHIPVRDLDRFAATVYRASTRAPNHRPNRAAAPDFLADLAAKAIVIDRPFAASA